MADRCSNLKDGERCCECGASYVCPRGNRYFLSVKLDGEVIEREVSVEEFCRAERAAGFRPNLSSSDRFYMTTPATGWFGGPQGICGRVVYGAKGDGRGL